MYSGITQAEMAHRLFMSESKYSRKENGRLKIERDEAIRIAKILDLNERTVMKYWISDKLYELMKHDRDLLYEALDIVESNYSNYESCVDMPAKSSSFSTLDERIRHRKKK